MTREELKEHCEKQIENCEMWARCKGEEPHGKVYEEHKLILELLEQETVSKETYDHEYFLRKELDLKIYKLERAFDKMRAEIVELQKEYQEYGWAYDDVLDIIDKYKGESEK